MARKFYSNKFKYEVIMAYQNEDHTLNEICLKYKVHRTTVYDWMEKFEKSGLSGLENSKTEKRYSKELKESAVRDYLSGEYSQREVIRMHGISGAGVLHKWIRKYNGHRELKDTGKGRSNSMTKGRKTTLEERTQIAIHCIDNERDYQSTAEKYEVSYQQVYQWVKKYEAGGSDALKDGRGKRKEELELSPEDKVKLEMKKLERENERLKTENLFLKKLEEIERRRR